MNAEMNTESDVQVSEDSSSEVEQRLAQIAAAMKARQSGDIEATSNKLVDGMACPIDPAERALCEGCQ